MQLEIEVRSDDARNDVYELRNFLREEMQDVQVNIKEQAAGEGEMALGLIEPIIIGVVKAAVEESIGNVYSKVLKPKIDRWLSSYKNRKLEVLSTLKDEGTKVHFLEDTKGRSEVFENLKYAIDTEHTRAVLIGNSEFDGGFNAIPPVKGNLEDFYHLLTDKLHIGLEPDNVLVVFNKTSNEIEEILLRQSRLPNTETLIIYFAGHGHRTDVKKLYLVAKNTKKIDDYLLGGIDFDFISNVVLRNATAKQKILILDACHSGIATQGTDDMMQKMDIKGSYVLASSPGDEVSYFEKNSRNTYFTGVLLNVLKDGIENSNEMIALDDLYEYSKDHLTEKNFPHPIYKNELNISPSNFFIARNPLFSFEKLRRRPELLMREGRFEDALYEYRMLLQKFPDDITIRQKVSECEVETLFSHLSQDGDEFFFAKNYKAATEKYKKALQVKDDLSVRGKLNKCNDFLRQNPIVEKNTIKKEDENVVRKIQSESIEADKEKNIKKHVHKDDTINITTPVSNDKISGILLASVWAVASFIFVASYLGDLESSKIFSRISVPAAIIGSILFGIRRSRVTITEILIYAHGLFFCVFPLIVELQDARGTSHTSATLVFLAYIVAYAILITRTLKGFKLVDMIIASVGILYLGSVFMSIFAYNIQSDEDGTRASSTGFIAGLILAIVAIILMRKKWLQLKKK